MKIKHNPVEHIKLLSNAIDRMGNNHIKCLFSLFTIIAFSLTMDKFLYDMSGPARIALLSSLFVISLSFQFMMVKISWNYLELEKNFRKIQENVINGKLIEWEMNPKSSYGSSKHKLSWIIKFSLVIVFLYAISQITLMVIILI